VYFEGQNVGSLKATFVTELTTDTAGDITDATMLPGDYNITVVPARADPYALTTVQRHLPSAEPTLDLPVGRKVHIQGRVTAHGGTPAVAGARVALALRRAPASREYSAQTDSNGRYALDVDPGDYDFAVEPTLGSALPRYRVLTTLAADQTVDIELYRPTFVYGRVLDQNHAAVSGVSLSFYSADPATDQAPLLLGLAITDSKGEFIVPLPKPDGT
jgi:protocatechuate 3,4-dioxygenase beta subunit